MDGTASPPSLRLAEDGRSIEILDQTRLPHAVEVRGLTTLDQVIEAIVTMQVRGAPLIGITAACGIGLAARADPDDAALREAARALVDTRPTAINLRVAVERMLRVVLAVPEQERADRAFAEAAAIVEEERAACEAIARHGVELVREIHRRRARTVSILTHCNAGRLATIAYGTALAPIYRAHEEGIPVRVMVDETRPRAQGWLTAWELGAAAVPHTLIPDTAAGHLLQRGEVDLVLVGTDRITRNGDVCNKVGTYLVALAARESQVPFYVAGPSSSIDWSLADGTRVPIEERDPAELTHLLGRPLGPQPDSVRNPAFDLTPARLVTGLITERGICAASEAGLRSSFPERCR